jgi:AraC family transcriptional regulator
MDQRIQDALDYIQANPNRRLPMERLAKSLNLSASRLRHLFKDEVGMTPNQYLRALKLRHAKNLLETTYLNVKEVMTKVGLADESHFVRDFEKACGLTPCRYRERHQALNQKATAIRFQSDKVLNASATRYKNMARED